MSRSLTCAFRAGDGDRAPRWLWKIRLESLKEGEVETHRSRWKRRRRSAIPSALACPLSLSLSLSFSCYRPVSRLTSETIVVHSSLRNRDGKLIPREINDAPVSGVSIVGYAAVSPFEQYLRISFAFRTYTRICTHIERKATDEGDRTLRVARLNENTRCICVSRL